MARSFRYRGRILGWLPRARTLGGAALAWAGLLVLAALVTACGSLPPVKHMAPTLAQPVDPNTPLAKIVSNSTPPGEESGFRLMPLGVYSLDARLQLARRAQRSLDVQYYVLENDSTGRLFLSALKDAAERGVQVRILVDDLYTAKSQGLLLALSAHRNVTVRLFNPFCCARDGLVSRFAASPFEIPRLNHRMHNKLFIADGVMAVAGGRNIADEYFILNEAQNFVDMDIFAMGKIIAQMEGIFDDYWNSEEVYPVESIVASPLPREALAAQFDRDVAAAGPLRSVPLPPTDLLGYGPIGEDLDGGRIGLLWGKASAVADPPAKLRSMTADEAFATSVTARVWKGLLLARSEVVMTSPYLVPGSRGMAAFEELRKRDVDVTLLTNSLAANDEPLVHSGYARYRGELLAMGVDLYELSPARTTKNKRLGMFGNSLGRLHAKTAVVDRERIFVGSVNLDPRSATENTELGIAVECPALAREMLRVINISKLESAYRLRLRPDSNVIEWLTFDNEKEVVLDYEPESTWSQRWSNYLIGPLVPEDLL